jgi:manganese transport protein
VQLIARLRREPVDLLVVGSHGHGMVRDLLYGQTVDKVRHRLGIPMLIARPDRTGPSHEPGHPQPPPAPSPPIHEPALAPRPAP